jgi:hypothetical protein
MCSNLINITPVIVTCLGLVKRQAIFTIERDRKLLFRNEPIVCVLHVKRTAVQHEVDVVHQNLKCRRAVPVVPAIDVEYKTFKRPIVRAVDDVERQIRQRRLLWRFLIIDLNAGPAERRLELVFDAFSNFEHLNYRHRRLPPPRSRQSDVAPQVHFRYAPSISLEFE